MDNHIYGKLNNNMKYLLCKNKCSKSTTIMYTIKVGSRNEINNIRGISHFIEHMLFKGTKNRETSKNISNGIYNYGAEFNATTSHESTSYYVKINTDYIEKAIDILSDMLYNSLFESAEITKEKKVVISENKKDRSYPTRILDKMMTSLIFKKTNLSYDIGGFDKDINDLTRNKIMKYFTTFYKPSNIIIAISGNYNYTNKKMVNILNQYFGQKINYINIPKKIKTQNIKYNFVKYSDFLNKQKTFQYIHKIKSLSQAYISIGFPCFNTKSKKSYTMDVISNILGGNMSSRLFIKLRENKGLIYTVSSSNDEYSDVGAFTIDCGTFGDEKSILQCIDIILNELHNLKHEIVQTTELSNNKNYINGNFLIGLEDSMVVADYNTHNLLFKNKLVSYKETKKYINDVTSKKIKEISNEIFKQNKCNIAIISKNKIKEQQVHKLVQKYL
jgi:predicted Zn-dependent peptidase